MKTQRIKFRDKFSAYSILIGNKVISKLPYEIKKVCPNTKKIAIIIDKNVPSKFKFILKRSLKSYNLFFLKFSANEKNKSLNSVNYFLKQLISKNLNRNDLIIGVGGGILNVVGFVASVFKRG